MKNRILAVAVLFSVLLAQALTPAQAKETAAPTAVVNLEALSLGAAVATGNFADREGASLLIQELPKPGAGRGGNSRTWKTHRHIFAWP